MNPSLYRNIDVREVGAPIAAANNTDGNSDRIDMAGHEGVIFIAPIEDSANTGVATLTAEQNSSDSDTGMDDLVGAVATATSAADDDLNGKLLVVDVYRPRLRYVQAQRKSATANIAFGTLIAILYGQRKMPVTAHSTIANAASAASPAE